MNNVKIIVLPSTFSMQNLVDSVKDFKVTCGSIFSSKDKINVNKVKDGYSILYKDNEFMNLDVSVFLATLINLFSKNIPGEDIQTELYYMFIDEDEFDERVAASVLEMDNMITLLTSSYSVPILKYKRSKNIDLIISMLLPDDGEDEEDDFNIFTSEGVNFNPDDYFMSMGNSGDDDDEDDDDGDDIESIFGQIYGKKKSKKKSAKKKEYDRSKVLSNAKSPKRSVNRHGVIIADSKSDISKDAKVIKEFLKDFIPGNQSWKKEFRNELVMRWINVYAITKKNLKRLENKQRKERRKKIESDRQKRLLNLSRQVFTVPVDRWSDPNR